MDGAAATSSSTARPARARPRSTSRRAPSMLERGLGAIVLVPEIALAPQTVGRVRARFGERVAILHSALTRRRAPRRARADRERRGAHRRRRALGDLRAGARPRPDRRRRGARLRRTSRTPIRATTRARSRRSAPRSRARSRSTAPRRRGPRAGPRSSGSRARRPHRRRRCRRCASSTCGARPGYPLSAPLLDDAARRRRAPRQGDPAAQPARHRAGAALPRVRDDDPLPELRRRARPARRHVSLRCHHCGYTTEAPSNCPACGSPDLARLGAGTQKLERELARELPELELIRLDADAVAKPEQLGGSRCSASATTEGVVLLGTQMVAKGHHFSGVELAAVIDADTGLAMPDFRAEERTFQLITQLAGRSGRDAPGRVLVQTFQPDARPIAHAARHDVGALPHGGARAAQGARLPAVRAPRADRRQRPRARAGRARARGAEGGDQRRRAARPGARSCACAASTARSSSRRRSTRGASPRRRRACSRPPPRRCGKAKLTAVVDVDPQSL